MQLTFTCVTHSLHQESCQEHRGLFMGIISVYNHHVYPIVFIVPTYTIRTCAEMKTVEKEYFRLQTTGKNYVL